MKEGTAGRRGPVPPAVATALALIAGAALVGGCSGASSPSAPVHALAAAAPDALEATTSTPGTGVSTPTSTTGAGAGTATASASASVVAADAALRESLLRLAAVSAQLRQAPNGAQARAQIAAQLARARQALVSERELARRGSCISARTERTVVGSASASIYAARAAIQAVAAESARRSAVVDQARADVQSRLDGLVRVVAQTRSTVPVTAPADVRSALSAEVTEQHAQAVAMSDLVTRANASASTVASLVSSAASVTSKLC